jgi:hypothetical protein
MRPPPPPLHHQTRSLQRLPHPAVADPDLFHLAQLLVKVPHVVVANQMDKQIIYLRVNSVPNVFTVTNDLQVEQS